LRSRPIGATMMPSVHFHKVNLAVPFVDCPSCHSSFHVGALYERHESCPRCGTPLTFEPRIRLPGSRIFSHRQPEAQVDWEAVTGSQYAPRARTLTDRREDSQAAV
jgi:hypothetical protein